MRGTDYVLKRIAFAIVTVFVAVSINFVLFRLAPGTAVSNLSRVPHATQQLRHALEKQFGLDKSKGEQYVIFLKQLVHGNLGISYENEQPVATNLRIELINTLPMVTLGMRPPFQSRIVSRASTSPSRVILFVSFGMRPRASVTT